MAKKPFIFKFTVVVSLAIKLNHSFSLEPEPNSNCVRLGRLMERIIRDVPSSAGILTVEIDEGPLILCATRQGLKWEMHELNLEAMVKPASNLLARYTDESTGSTPMASEGARPKSLVVPKTSTKASVSLKRRRTKEDEDQRSFQTQSREEIEVEDDDELESTGNSQIDLADLKTAEHWKKVLTRMSRRGYTAEKLSKFETHGLFRKDLWKKEGAGNWRDMVILWEKVATDWPEVISMIRETEWAGVANLVSTLKQFQMKH